MADCVFCKIAQKEIPSNVVYEDDDVIAFRDLEPQAPVHVLVIPKRHFADLLSFTRAERTLAGHILAEVIPQVATELGLAEGGFRVVTNTGQDGGQTVPHLHFHILGGRAMTWPPG